MANSIPYVAALILALAQTSTPEIQWQRHYTPGQVLHYEMTGDNRGWKYTLHATDTIARKDDGTPYEQVGWSDLTSNAPFTLSPASLAFRQNLSLAGDQKYLAIPDLSTVQPFLIGPITDLLTFYADLFLARTQGLSHVGDHALFERDRPNSWANGTRLLVAQDAVDFDLTLEKASAHTATFHIRHLPPRQLRIATPAPWMKTPVFDTPNNWVQVSHQTGHDLANATYVTDLGRETFDVHITLDTRDGKILSASLDNQIDGTTRDCTDAALEHCTDPQPESIHRNVQLRLEN